MASANTLRSLKIALRKRINAQVAAMSQQQRELESESIQQRVLALESYRASTNVCTFLSFPGELSTDRIVADLLRVDSNKRCFVPVIRGADLVMVHVKSKEDLDSFVPNRWGIPEPIDAETRSDALDDGSALDLIIMPGTAFSRDGSRIGRGKGYYDRYLARIERTVAATGRAKPITVAVGFSTQLLNDGEIPMEATDRRVDVIVTPNSH